MILKVASSEDMPDESPHKCKSVYEVMSVTFYRNPSAAYATLKFSEKESLEVLITGNAYLMNNNGKTIEVFAHSKYHGGSN